MVKASINQIWKNFRKQHPQAPESYEAWAFGDSKEMADELAQLVLDGTKTATASNYTLYELEKEPLPHVGLHNIILNGDGEAVAIVETTSVTVVPFHEVTAKHAFMEGEGDRSLAYWRDVHQAFFEKELQQRGLAFHDGIPVVCEVFALRYK